MNKGADDPYTEHYQYVDAIKIFEELGDFKDSSDKIFECYDKSVPSSILVADNDINDGDIWGANTFLKYFYVDYIPTEIDEYMKKDIFKLIADWKFQSKNTSLRIDLEFSFGSLDIIAANGVLYKSFDWKIKNNKIYGCPNLSDCSVDGNYIDLFTIVSVTDNQLVIKNSQQSFTLNKQ